MTLPTPRWSQQDWVELMLMLKKVPAGVRELVAAAEQDSAAPSDWVESLAHLNQLCDAFGRAPLVTVEHGIAHFDVAESEWVAEVLDKYR